MRRDAESSVSAGRDRMERIEIEWRWFEWKQVREAKAFALAGGIAVHHNRPGWNGHDAAHLLGPDEATLIAAALELGLLPIWLQRPPKTRVLHFDLRGWTLRMARRKCGIADEA
ncbi:MAG TPA: hypothetical protein VNQ79_17460 [Blastocatellia bacterium]|nr:hypothetical protein [Blastocatellia bacterium]